MHMGNVYFTGGADATIGSDLRPECCNPLQAGFPLKFGVLLSVMDNLNPGP
jgi:hypothetical protein